MNITIALRDQPTHDTFHAHFHNTPNITLQIGDILEMDGDTLISPANSFGWMNGGIDAHYIKNLGPQLQQTVHQAIHRQPFAELLVGQALAVGINSPHHPQLRHLIIAPTMRIPSTIDHTVNVYLAFRAALHTTKHIKTQTLLTPALGTGIGKVPPNTAAAQMKTALHHAHQTPNYPPPPLQHHYIQHQTLTAGKTGKPT